jgi:hypothetical protein
MDSEDIVRKFHQKRGRIRDAEKIHPGSRIQGVKKHRIPDPDPQHWGEVNPALAHFRNNSTVHTMIKLSEIRGTRFKG